MPAITALFLINLPNGHSVSGVEICVWTNTQAPLLTAGAFTAMLGALSLNNWAIIVGIICTAGTFVVNWYYRHREFNRNGKDQD
ncbi:Similar to bacteriophage Gp13 protein (modular protein) [Xenorhabdus szentirmaii DSM 16338]|uniref:Similar to bacteriophage Gp13 protein (Modular protein) n=1 Tax=Xenorhabdus szentirmaii DSM 16338 TaxID=1427518 RepID=W1J1X4_9GAMM|nr:Similar to bacteriophage Gp13 protein (modular protein) [Xenorhabdus szentirmaii DSM 16338]